MVVFIVVDLKEAREAFQANSSMLYQKIVSALDEHGQKSDNMTALSQLSSQIADQQVDSLSQSAAIVLRSSS